MQTTMAEFHDEIDFPLRELKAPAVCLKRFHSDLALEQPKCFRERRLRDVKNLRGFNLAITSATRAPPQIRSRTCDPLLS